MEIYNVLSTYYIFRTLKNDLNDLKNQLDPKLILRQRIIKIKPLKLLVNIINDCFCNQLILTFNNFINI